jgi:uncharacterized protein YcsI (UPF0317 family)
MNRRKRLWKRINCQSLKRYQSRTKMMITKTLRMMARSTQGILMKEIWEEDDLKLMLRVMAPKFCPPLQVSNTQCPVFLQHQAKLARFKNLYMILILCLKLRLVAQI